MAAAAPAWSPLSIASFRVEGGETFFEVTVAGVNGVSRRSYAQFEQFDKQWRAVYPQVPYSLQHGNTGESDARDFNERRRVKLQVYMQQLVNVAALRFDVAEFLGCPEKALRQKGPPPGAAAAAAAPAAAAAAAATSSPVPPPRPPPRKAAAASGGAAAAAALGPPPPPPAVAPPPPPLPSDGSGSGLDGKHEAGPTGSSDGTSTGTGGSTTESNLGLGVPQYARAPKRGSPAARALEAEQQRAAETAAAQKKALLAAAAVFDDDEAAAYRGSSTGASSLGFGPTGTVRMSAQQAVAAVAAAAAASSPPTPFTTISRTGDLPAPALPPRRRGGAAALLKAPPPPVVDPPPPPPLVPPPPPPRPSETGAEVAPPPVPPRKKKGGPAKGQYTPAPASKKGKGKGAALIAAQNAALVEAEVTSPQRRKFSAPGEEGDGDGDSTDAAATPSKASRSGSVTARASRVFAAVQGYVGSLERAQALSGLVIAAFLVLHVVVLGVGAVGGGTLFELALGLSRWIYRPFFAVEWLLLAVVVGHSGIGVWRWYQRMRGFAADDAAAAASGSPALTAALFRHRLSAMALVLLIPLHVVLMRVDAPKGGAGYTYVRYVLSEWWAPVALIGFGATLAAGLVHAAYGLPVALRTLGWGPDVAARIGAFVPARMRHALVCYEVPSREFVLALVSVGTVVLLLLSGVLSSGAYALNAPSIGVVYAGALVWTGACFAFHQYATAAAARHQ